MKKADLFDARELAETVAREVGSMLLDRFCNSEGLEIDQKGDGVHNLVTEMDLAAENLLRERLCGTFQAEFLGEESGGSLDQSGLYWVVDPIDGTVNYAHSIPNWCVSIGLVENNVPIVGVIFDPNRNEIFASARGMGATCNGEPIQVSSTSNLTDSLLVTGFPYNVAENPFGAIETFGRVLSKGIAVRRFGSAALDLAWIAAGRFDGFWEVALKPWDVAAGILIAVEAGARISTYSKNFQDSVPTQSVVLDRVVATNGKIDQELYKLLVS